MNDTFTMEITDRVEQLVDDNARIWFVQVSSFAFNVRDKVAPSDEIFNNVPERSAGNRQG